MSHMKNFLLKVDEMTETGLSVKEIAWRLEATQAMVQQAIDWLEKCRKEN